MSASIYNGGLIGSITADRRPYIRDDGNWSLQGQPVGEGPAFRTLLLDVNGRSVYGYLPTGPRDPYAEAVTRQGVFTRSDLLAWRGPQLQPGDTAEMTLKGGNRYLGWGDTAGEDWMEYGSQDPVDASRTIHVTTGALLVPGEPLPPPVADMPNPWRTIRANGLAEETLATATFEKWRAANPKEYAAIEAYLAAIANGKTVPPPSLRTHRGRAVCAILQGGAATFGRLPA